MLHWNNARMSTQLHQLQLAYAPIEDRLLFRVKTRDLAEIRLWLTRRLVMLLWPALLDQLAGNEQVQRQASEDSRKSVMAFQHEQAVAKADFGRKFTDQVETTPLGTVPILVSRIRLKPGGVGRRTVCFYPDKGQGIEVAMDDKLLHSFCKLLADAVGKTGWGLDIAVAGEPGAAAPVERRSLN
jgi:hypothetical protein